MSITVNVGPLSCYTYNKQVVDVKGNTVIECLRHLIEQYPKLEFLDSQGNLMAHIDIFIDGLAAYPNLMNKPVSDGDKITLALMICGG